MAHLDLYVNYKKDKRQTCCCNKHNPLCNYGLKGKCQRIKVKFNPYVGIEEKSNNG